LTIKADIGNPNHPLQLSPERAEFGQVLVGADNRAVVKLTNNSTKMLKIRFVDIPSPKQIQDVNISNSSANPLVSTEIEFVLNDFMMLGDFKTSLTIESGGDLSTRTTIPISGTVAEKKKSAK